MKPGLKTKILQQGMEVRRESSIYNALADENNVTGYNRSPLLVLSFLFLSIVTHMDKIFFPSRTKNTNAYLHTYLYNRLKPHSVYRSSIITSTYNHLHMKVLHLHGLL